MLSPARILQILADTRESQLVLAGLELGLFTELGKGPRSAGQISRALSLSARSVSAWLDALVALGVLNRDGAGERAIYLNSRESGQFLDRNSPAYIGALFAGRGSRSTAEWEALLDGLHGGNVDPERSCEERSQE